MIFLLPFSELAASITDVDHFLNISNDMFQNMAVLALSFVLRIASRGFMVSCNMDFSTKQELMKVLPGKR